MFGDRGINVSRSYVANRVGHAGVTTAEELAAGLNRINGGWRGGIVDHGAFDALNASGSWGAMLGRGRIGHWVVVDGVERGHVLLRDPARGMIRMAFDEFMEAWNGSVVFR